MGENESCAWSKSRVPNIVRYNASKIYFARVRIGGKLFRKSLETDKITVAEERLRDFVKEKRKLAEGLKAFAKGKMTFGNALKIYENRLQANAHLKESSKFYRSRCLKTLLNSWMGIKEKDISSISSRDCLDWASQIMTDYSPTVFNNTVGTLQQIFEIAIEAGARYGNPAKDIKKARVRIKDLVLPSREDFLKLVASIENAGGGKSKHCANLVRFLAFGGFRKGEAQRVTGDDCDFGRGEVVVRGDPKTGTKNWDIRRVPMIPDMRDLLELLRDERGEDWIKSPVMKVRECQNAINSACNKIGIKRITHHDLRHLFATHCIESRVDIPTVSRWLGHKDGGALAMRVYGHLRLHHSNAMAQRVTFSKTIPIEDTFVEG